MVVKNKRFVNFSEGGGRGELSQSAKFGKIQQNSAKFAFFGNLKVLFPYKSMVLGGPKR
jgi:hypothetical protein